MKLLTEISEATLGVGEVETLDGNYRLRKSARAVLRNKEGNIAVQYLQNYNFHKLPGGGVDTGETLEKAVTREVKEEVGCNCVVGTLLGTTIEYRNKYNLLHISYAYAADVVGEIGEPELEEGEIEEGQITLWIPATEALEKMKTDVPKKYEGNFILKREISFLEEYLKIVES